MNYFNSVDGKLMPSYDRELELSSPTGTKISVLLHGQTAKNISCDEVGAEVCFGPMKLVRSDYIVVRYQFNRCGMREKRMRIFSPSLLRADVATGKAVSKVCFIVNNY